MGAIYRNGEIYGSNMAINDAQTSENTTWSSEKIAERTGGNSGVPFIFDSTHHTGASFNCNDLHSGIAYVAKECINVPFNSFWNLILTFEYSDKYAQQLGWCMGQGEHKIAFRVKDNDTYYNWHYINFDT